MQDGVDYVFPAGARITPGSFLVVVKDMAAFNLAYPFVTNVYGPFANGTGLNNTGERVALADAGGTIVSEVTYADRAPWPEQADGDGSSLELRQPRGPLGQAWNWAASPEYGGTQHIVNGTFDTSATNWLTTGNHSNSYYTSSAGYAAPGCMTIVARGAGGSSANSLNCYTSPSLINDGPQYVLSFAHRLAPTNSRTWLRYYVGSTNWHLLRINEVMPYNTATRADNDGEYSDWFEIYNSGNAPLNLSDCAVSDDADNPWQWRFPDVVLGPGAHLLVWASGKNRTSGQLHTSFALSAEGELLLLTDAYGREIDRVTWGALPADVSYGCLPDGVKPRVFFTSATPGSTNLPPGYAAIAETPSVSRPGGFFLGTLVLTLQVQNAQAQIRYTLDGSVPHSNSTLYSAPLTLSVSARLAARAFQPGLLPSLIARHEYYRTMPSILTSSPLPIIVVDTHGQAIPDEPKIDAFIGIISNGTGRNTVSDPFHHFEGRIGIEIRGQSSQNEPQKQYAFETRAEDGEDRDTSLLGFPPESDWVLYAPYNDKTLMRNVLAYDAFTRMGWYASRTMFCELVLNGDYRGVYVFMEKIKRAPGRVNITKLRAVDNSPPAVSGGYIIKIDKTDSGDVTFLTDEGTRFIHVYPRSDRVTAAQRAWIRSYVTNFEASVRSSNYANPVTGYARYIDVPSFIDTYLIVQAWKNIDGLRLSAYFYKDRNGKLFMGPAWDYNISLGNANYYNGQYTNGWYTTGDYYAIPFWWERFRADTNFMALCRARWQALRKDILHRTNFAARIDAIAAALDEPQRRHFQRWPILGTYVWPNYYYTATSYVQEVTWMKNWAAGRMAWMDGEWNTLLADFAATPRTALVGQTVVFTNFTYGSASAFKWEFGDGGASSVRHPVYTYITAGSYDVTLVVSNYTAHNGWSKDILTRTNYLYVLPEPAVPCAALAWLTRVVMRRRHE